MTISYLSEHPDFVPGLAPEIAAHWQPYLPEESIEKRLAKLRAHMNTTTLPIAWVAHNGSEVLGTAALRVHDLEGREDLTPWLGGVFVRHQFRGRGVASALCRVAEDAAWAHGFDRLFLFTLDHPIALFPPRVGNLRTGDMAGPRKRDNDQTPQVG